MKVYVDGAAIAETVALLQEDGRFGRESVVLWLGRRRGNETRVVEVLRPEQQAGRDFFRIPPNAMTALQHRLREQNLMIAAQVHSHPMEAFHSEADDAWAIVRHVGALSLVLPEFAQHVTPATFWSDAAIFALDTAGLWLEAAMLDHVEYCP